MHHIALEPHALRILILSHTHACAIDHAEPESEIQEEQSLSEYTGPQALSCEDTNLALDQGKP
jgi:hypothetical protein